MLTNVAVIVFDGVAPFELGVLCEAWGVDRTASGVPAIEFAVCSANAGRVSTSMGFDLHVEHGLDRAAEADLVCIPAIQRDWPVPDDVLQLLRDTVDRGARVLSVCSGAFLLGQAGLLDGRDCTTHWMHSDDLQAQFPKACVVPEVLYVDEGSVITSAGSAAGLDACLHLWRKEYGGRVASTVARRMVVPPQREGGQAQYIARPVPDCTAETLGPLLTWISENIAEDHSVEELARRAHMSPRTFARRFRAETGGTPHAWVTNQRVIAAEELLEASDSSIEWIATEVGFGNAATMRQHFSRVRGISPQAYRLSFSCPA
ncbi:helix-turn-helix domain-containing protein [Nocardioides marmoriginsengisoli]|uniref:Helix-turn-helix domain-containing protein n=1 Tax=Nocardioides marmoriginsengisoli TaxID=661483 RepID=A0A3N0CNP0_9ACTN|nr:helix-turn-helix domain-containing protein [Nocardioides marmoriginsengisoli]RNL64921.1 helix-turn-helix domain-containing protein [Nocardioides marmoriginsengisoli]